MRNVIRSFWLGILTAGILGMFMAVTSPPETSIAEYQEIHDADTLLTFQRTACFGPCPVYEIVVREDGTLTYEGHSEVKIEGIVEDTLSPCEMQHLRAAFAEVDFFSFESSYTTGSICSEVMMDAPTVRTFFRDGERSHRVVHYRGCRGFPNRDVLIELENEVDRILRAERWTGVER